MFTPLLLIVGRMKKLKLRVEYKAAEKVVQKAVAVAKNNAFETLYQRLETEEGEKDVSS